MEIDSFSLESIHLLSVDELENKFESAFFALERRYEEMGRIEALQKVVESEGVSSYSMEALRTICPDAFDELFTTSVFTSRPTNFNLDYGLESFSNAVAATLAFIGKYIQYIIPLIIAAVVTLIAKLFGDTEKVKDSVGGGGKKDNIGKVKKDISDIDEDIKKLKAKIKSTEAKKKVDEAYEETVAKVDKGPSDAETHKRHDVSLLIERINSLSGSMDYHLATGHPAFRPNLVNDAALSAISNMNRLMEHVNLIYTLLDEQLNDALHGKDLYENIKKIDIMYKGADVYKSPYIWNTNQQIIAKGDPKVFAHMIEWVDSEGGWDVEFEDTELDISWGRIILNGKGQPATKLKEYKVYGDVHTATTENFSANWSMLNMSSTLDELHGMASTLKGVGTAMKKKSDSLTKKVSKFTKKSKNLTNARDAVWARDKVVTTILCYPDKIKSRSKNYVYVGEDLAKLPNDLNTYDARVSWINNGTAISRLTGQNGPIVKLLDGVKREYTNFKDCASVISRTIHAWEIILEYRKACEELKDIITKIDDK